MNVTAAKRLLITQFRDSGLDTPDLDARLLVMAVTDFTHTDLITRGRESLSAEDTERLADYASRRLSGEPIDHILGYREFFGRRFLINKNVLSPRPETEMLVEAALEVLRDTPKARILDLGTGSGAIIISILAEAAQIKGVAIDLSAAALSAAKRNAKSHAVDERLTFLQGSWFDPVEGEFDIILSNPPYITNFAMNELDTEVSKFDPDIALRGGEDGLMAYKAIIAKARKHMKPAGVLLFEIGYDQGKAVSELLKSAGFDDISVLKDLSSHDRMIKAKRKA